MIAGMARMSGGRAARFSLKGWGLRGRALKLTTKHGGAGDVINLFFWTSLISGVFALAAYNQASDPGWKVPAVAVAVALLAVACLLFGWSNDPLLAAGQIGTHPDRLKWSALFFAAGAALLVFLGAVVGTVFKAQTSPARIGGYAFVVAFIGFLLALGLAA